MDFVSKYVIFGRNDRIFTKGEDSHALRLESEPSDLQAVNANLRCFATRIELTHHSDKKDLTARARSCLVGMEHSPTAKQDSVCGSKHRRLESDLKGKRRLIAVRQTSLDGRNDRIRTCDIVLPKHARYQLRYIPK